MANYKARCVKLTRKYVRKMLKNAEDSFVVGFEDAESGKPCVSREIFCMNGRSETMKEALGFCYSLYVRGYSAGLKGGEGK